MSEAAIPRLLVRERIQLDEVASALREGRRMVAFLVGEAGPRAAALAYLRERSGAVIPDPVVLSEPWQTLDALTDAGSRSTTEVRSLLVDHRSPHVLETLNWHRERLRKGASVLIWIDGIDGLVTLRALGKDAYSFRDMMIVVEGERPVQVLPPVEDTIDIQLARIPYEAADDHLDRAEAAARLASKLQGHAPTEDIISLVLRAISSLSDDSHDDRSLYTRAALCQALASLRLTNRELAEGWRWSERGLASLNRSSGHDSPLRGALLLAGALTPLGFDLATLTRAAEELSPAYNPLALVAASMSLAAEYALKRGDVRLLRHLHDAMPTSTSPVSRASVLTLLGKASLSAGDIAKGEDLFQQAVVVLLGAGLGTAPSAVWLAESLRLRAELPAARRIFSAVLASSDDGVPRHIAARARAEAQLDTGEVTLALASLRSVLHDAATSRSDGHLYEGAVAYTSSLRAAHEAGRLAPTDLTDADAELQVAEDVALSIAGDDVPWYSILFPALRAEVLSLRPDRLPEAIILTSAALDRSRDVWIDAAPMHARMLVAHLVRAGRLDEARAALALAVPEAEAQRHLIELARLRAHAVAVLVQTSAATTEIDTEMASLRVALEETGAPRIAADTLLELSLLLPPSSSHPDPLALLDEACSLFADMPIPAQEARCVEAMGDVLAARGDAPGARGRYLAAKGTYERFGLGLRVPRIAALVGGGEPG